MTTEGFKRKITAILRADVVGYSRLMGEDEAATVKTLATYREVMVALIKQHRGRVVDSPGDNVLAEFASVVDGVQCAVAVQKEFQARNADLPEGRRMEFRIGINLGDVIEEEHRIYGDGVNIAARLEALADSGGICISKTAFDQIETKLPLGYEYLGEQTVKNIPRPVGAYRVFMEPRVTVAEEIEEEKAVPLWRRKAIFAGATAVLVAAIAVAIWNFYFRPPAMAVASVEKMAFALPDKPSIAVLPFVNLSEDPKQEYLSDGVTENIITALSRVPRLFVIARNSTFTYKGKPVKVQKVAEDLGVRYIVEGTVQRSKDEVRITAHLVDAINGKHLWAERYDRVLKDVFALQGEITMKIITTLQVKLTEGEYARLHLKGTNNLEAYLTLLEGRAIWASMTKEAILRGRELFKEAIALDPEYADAYAHLGFTHANEAWFGYSKSRRESRERALELAQKAIALDENNKVGRGLLSYIYRQRRQYEKALAEMERLIDLYPSDADSLINLSNRLSSVGRGEEAIAASKKAIHLNPVAPWWYFTHLGHGHWVMGQYEEAITAYKEAKRRSPNHYGIRVRLAATYSLAGRGEEARDEAAEVLRLKPDFSVDSWAKRIPFKKAYLERFVNAMRKAGLK
jgi:adenylate cyclase